MNKVSCSELKLGRLYKTPERRVLFRDHDCQKLAARPLLVAGSLVCPIFIQRLITQEDYVVIGVITTDSHGWLFIDVEASFEECY